MGKTYGEEQKDSQHEDPQSSLKLDSELVEGNGLESTKMKLKGLFQTLQSQQILTSDVSQLYTSKESFLQIQHRMDLRIPNRVRFLSLNEKFLQRCLDFVEVRASDPEQLYIPAAPCSIALDVNSSQMKLLFDRSEPRSSRRQNIGDLSSLSIHCPLATGAIDVVMNTFGQWLVDTVDRKSILKVPLYNHLGTSENDKNVSSVGSFDDKETKFSELAYSPSVPSIVVPQNLEAETTPPGNCRHGSGTLNKRLPLTSNTSSTYPNQSSSSSATSTQGMLHCIWKNGLPYFVFSLADQKEVYVANLWKLEPSENKDIDYIYLFHSRTCGKKVKKNLGVPDAVGRMKVSSSMTLSSNNSKVMETEFVLFVDEGKHNEELQTSVPTLINYKGIPKKVVDILRTNHLFIRSSAPKFGGPTSVVDDIYRDSNEGIYHKLETFDRANLLGNSPGLELATIVVKDLLPNNSSEGTVGGWGLKFLEKAPVQPAKSSSGHSICSDTEEQHCVRNRTDCCTSTTVLLPAGIHGGPRTKCGGPSSLIDRWRSGGQCDCGGWDIGCPLMVLTSRLVKEPLDPHTGAGGENKSFGLFREGSEQILCTMKMTNINDDSYTIDFQTSLSALQAFSIGIATIHSRNRALAPRNFRSLKQL